MSSTTPSLRLSSFNILEALRLIPEAFIEIIYTFKAPETSNKL